MNEPDEYRDESVIADSGKQVERREAMPLVHEDKEAAHVRGDRRT